MIVSVFESNLMWSQRFKQSLTKLGHTCQILGPGDAIDPTADIAIVNLGDDRFHLGELIENLKQAGVYVIGHAGHKEKELHSLGRELGCDKLATNSEITFKLEQLLSLAK